MTAIDDRFAKLASTAVSGEIDALQMHNECSDAREAKVFLMIAGLFNKVGQEVHRIAIAELSPDDAASDAD